jgi:hypothetical protein
MQVLIGVDPHKATNVVAAVDEQGEAVGQETLPADRKGMRALERWAKHFPERSWAVEGAGGIGRPLAQKLLASGERVVDVPPKLSARVRVLSTGNARKNDRLDATFTALAALRNDRLASVQPEDGPEGRAEILRLLTERREDLVAEHTRALNRLHVLLRDLLRPTWLGIPPPCAGRSVELAVSGQREPVAHHLAAGSLYWRGAGIGDEAGPGRETPHVADRADDPCGQYGTHAEDLSEGGARGFDLGLDALVEVRDLSIQRPQVAQDL